jgi:hypothetical protein
MTPKEKAFELYGIFCAINEDTAKQCALKAVEELIKETGSKYWYDVKREIELL